MAAQLSSTAQGGGGGRRVKLACSGGWGLGLDQNMQLFTSIQPHKLLRRRRCLRSLDSTRLYSSSSSSSSRNKAKRFNSEAHLFVDGGDHDEGDGVHGGDDDGDHVEYYERDDDLSGFRGLVLDISYRPVNVVCWKRAICLEFMEKADVLEYYDQTVNSPSGSYYIPAVLRVPHLLQIVKRRRIKNSLSRKNILCRDSFTCQVTQEFRSCIRQPTQFIINSSPAAGTGLRVTDLDRYCSSRENLTIDHVFPIARGGQWKWDNLVTACARCNSKKGQKTLEEANMKLMKVPKAPKDYDILAIPLTSAAIKMLKMRKGTPEEWLQYLSNSKPPPSSEP